MDQVTLGGLDVTLLGFSELARQIHMNPYYGSAVALGTLIFILVILQIQNKNTKDTVRQYRHYEVALILRNKLSVHRLVDYHRGIVWRDFAAISTSSGVAGAALMFGGGGAAMSYISGANHDGSGLSEAGSVVLMVSIAVQVASAIMMMICDFIHTNTISPLVPPLQRMRIVGEAIVMGGGAMIFNIAALISFMAVFSPWISVFCSIIFVMVVMRLTRLRAIKVQELRRWLKLLADEDWDMIDELVRKTGKKRRDEVYQKWYAEYWSDEYEDPCKEK